MKLTQVTIGVLFAASTNAAPQPQKSTYKQRAIAKRDITGYDNLGCYTETTNGRALSSTSYADDALTLELCQSACQGYDYFGLEYGREVSYQTTTINRMRDHTNPSNSATAAMV
jgi:hypothetical protein